MHAPKSLYLVFLLGLSILFFAACGEEVSMPRPWGFHRIEFPDSTIHKQFANSTCPFTFEYPDFGEISRDRDDSCWVDIYFPRYNCKWHISHRDKTEQKEGRSLYEDFRKLVFKHVKKASAITDIPVETPYTKGMKYEIYGNVGTPIEVFLHNEAYTMTLDMYFFTAQHNDSLAPIIDYMKHEIDHSIRTFRWK